MSSMTSPDMPGLEEAIEAGARHFYTELTVINFRTPHPEEVVAAKRWATGCIERAYPIIERAVREKAIAELRDFIEETWFEHEEGRRWGLRAALSFLEIQNARIIRGTATEGEREGPEEY